MTYVESLAELKPVILLKSKSKSTFFNIAILTIEPGPLYTVCNLKTNICSVYGAVGSPAYNSLATQVHKRTLNPSLSWY